MALAQPRVTQCGCVANFFCYVPRDFVDTAFFMALRDFVRPRSIPKGSGLTRWARDLNAYPNEPMKEYPT
tara:strand:- start:281 stop:490 length:210 start_codon:yes stop_codon:yes gene_type:complete